ncbi:MAG: DUF2802 domain-containing protein [Gammaproteobacteria bacterium]
MTTTDPVLLGAAIGAAILTLVTVATLVLAALRQRGRLRRLEAALADRSERIARLEADLAALLSCSRRIGDRIVDVERSDRTLQKQIDRLACERDEGSVAVEHAAKLLAAGRDLAEITELCDLTAGEVEVLQNLSRFRPAA